LSISVYIPIVSKCQYIKRKERGLVLVWFYISKTCLNIGNAFGNRSNSHSSRGKLKLKALFFGVARETSIVQKSLLFSEFTIFTSPVNSEFFFSGAITDTSTTNGSNSGVKSYPSSGVIVHVPQSGLDSISQPKSDVGSPMFST